MKTYYIVEERGRGLNRTVFYAYRKVPIIKFFWGSCVIKTLGWTAEECESNLYSYIKNNKFKPIIVKTIKI